MPSYICLELNASKGTAKFNFGQNDSGKLGIQRCCFTGLTSTAQAFISFSNWATSSVLTGTNDLNNIPLNSQKFFLPIVSSPVSTYEFHHPIFIMGGDNQTTGIKEVQYEVTDILGNPIPFTLLIIWMECIEVSRNWPNDGDRRVPMQTRKELTERNVFFGYDNAHQSSSFTFD